jgi:hypothetical protein
MELGSVFWHAGVEVERGAFEHLSFSSSDEIKRTAKNFLDYEIREGSSIAGALKAFNDVCELRHCIVHSHSLVSGKNAIRLNIRRLGSNMVVNLGVDQLHECALICSSLVQSFNIELFKEMCQRWAVDWRQPKTRNYGNRTELFDRIWNIFRSKNDVNLGIVGSRLSQNGCRKLVEQTYRK